MHTYAIAGKDHGMRIALLGNPNSGKTTLFNRLTGSNQYVGNWPGVTVEKKEGKLRSNKEIVVTDLPGVYSLSPYTPEEVVTRDYILDEHPDVVINIIDGTNLERNLYLADQAIEMGVPVVVAVNMIDAVRRSGARIDQEKLSGTLGCPVCMISALKGEGVDELVKQATNGAQAVSSSRTHFAPEIEQTLSLIGDEALADISQAQKRWYAIKLFEGDTKVEQRLHLDPTLCARISSSRASCERALDDESESLITMGRYDRIEQIIEHCTSQDKKKSMSTSDKIDRVVTSRALGLPIFALVMFLVYFLSVTTVGQWATDWMNDGVFGDGWFISGDAEGYEDASSDFTSAEGITEAFEEAGVSADIDPESESFVEDMDAQGITGIYNDYDEDSGEEEDVIVDGAAFEDAQETVDAGEPNPADYGVWVAGIPTLLAGWLASIDCIDWLQDLLLNGIVAGVGAVIGFIPQLLVLFLLLAVLESCGYMSRIAFVLDRVFRRFGLSGKSFVPILIGTGCGVPGIMASRTIEDDKDRRMTVMTTTFIPCSAKLPIIALLAGAVFGGAWWVAPSAYFIGIAAILCSGIILKKTKLFAGDSSPFVMELPAYHMPMPSVVLRSMLERASSFVKKAGTVILLATVVVWLVSTYGVVDGILVTVEDNDQSMLAAIAGAIAWIFAPLGWDQWQAVAATVTGLIAKENVVGTFGIVYAGDAGWYANLQAAFLPAAAFSLLVFNLLCAPCVAAMGAIRREMHDTRWFWTAIGYQCGVAYVSALIVYQIGGLFTGETALGAGTLVAALLIALFLFALFRPKPSTQASVLSVKKAKGECA